jgi:two-component system chemotaxis response regulator CheB
VDIIAIGVSTGGPNALAEVVPKLPANLPVPVVIVQHMPPLFTKMLAERLDSQTALSVVEGVNDQVVEAGKIYIAPGNYHMVLRRDGACMRLSLNQEPPENSCRPAVDPLFRSVVQNYGGHVLGVILTGMGQDGLRGCEHIREQGGQVITQDESSSVVWGMPGYVTQAGLSDAVLPLPQIAGEIARRVGRSRAGWKN